MCSEPLCSMDLSEFKPGSTRRECKRAPFGQPGPHLYWFCLNYFKILYLNLFNWTMWQSWHLREYDVRYKQYILERPELFRRQLQITSFCKVNSSWNVFHVNSKTVKRHINFFMNYFIAGNFWAAFSFNCLVFWFRDRFSNSFQFSNIIYHTHKLLFFVHIFILPFIFFFLYLLCKNFT